MYVIAAHSLDICICCVTYVCVRACVRTCVCVCGGACVMLIPDQLIPAIKVAKDHTSNQAILH